MDSDRDRASASPEESTDRGVGTDERGPSASAPSPAGPLPLSVVVVTRNEADRVAACLDSVVDACRRVPAYELFVVDSNSSDDTVERASEYPATVLQIPADDLSTPAAGRHVGTAFARGEAILFVDGDMVLEPAWLPAAMERLVEPHVAAVDGWLNEAEADAISEVDAVRGVALYDADALDEVGGFDPTLHSLEDIHLGFQLSTAGYRLERLPVVAARHPDPDPYPELFRRWRHGYTVGTGQTLRAAASSPTILAKHVHRLRYRFTLLCWLTAGVLAVRRRSTTAAWLGLAVAAFAVVASKRGVRGAVTFGVQKVVGLVGALVGLGTPRQPPVDYPLEAIEVVDRSAMPDRDDTDAARPSRR